ncbi:MAG: hypothetical protein ACOC2F_01875 [Bacteroidota bacterium]
MSKTDVNNTINKSWLDPDTELTLEDFTKGIEKAEHGSFKSVQDSMIKFEKWMKDRSKK